MVTRTNIYIAAAAAFLIIVATAAAGWQSYRVGRLERRAGELKEIAAAREAAADEAEKRAQIYKSQIEYLERNIAEIGELARRQDEELERIGDRVGRARDDVGRARGIRAIGSTTDELCERLGRLGHGCEER